MPYLIRFLLILLGIYLFGILIFRIILPALLKWFVKRKLKQHGFNHDPKVHKNKFRKEGQVEIDHIPDKDSSENKSKYGDYIDYEEIK